jgi:hypothetical protein
MSADHMQALRTLAVERALNAEIAKYAVMNIAYGVQSLEAHLHGSTLRTISLSEIGTKVIYHVAVVRVVS